jgi:hypothetical protein
MTSSYRRDHLTNVANDEFEALDTATRLDITTTIATFVASYPLGDDPSSGEMLALQRAFARYLIDSGKASANGVLSA